MNHSTNLLTAVDDGEREPTASELDVIEAEMPLITAEIDLLDAHITVMDRAPTELDMRRLRRATGRVLAARRQAANRAAEHAPEVSA